MSRIVLVASVGSDETLEVYGPMKVSRASEFGADAIVLLGERNEYTEEDFKVLDQTFRGTKVYLDAMMFVGEGFSGWGLPPWKAVRWFWCA